MTEKAFSLTCYCAVRDEPYVMNFVRQSNGKYHCVESVKVVGKSSGQAFVTSVNTIRVDQIEGRLPCAWCGSCGINHCAQNCGAFVCGGRKRGKAFICRDSCGATWEGIPLETVSGETVQECLLSPVPQNMVNPKLRSESTALVRVPAQKSPSKSWWRK